MGNPRAVIERVHEYDGGARRKGGDRSEEKDDKGSRRLRIQGFDLKDCFTDVPRGEMQEYVRRALHDLKLTRPRGRYF